MEEESRNSPPGPWKVQQRFIWIVNPETGLEEDKLMEVANLDHDVVSAEVIIGTVTTYHILLC